MFALCSFSFVVFVGFFLHHISLQILMYFNNAPLIILFSAGGYMVSTFFKNKTKRNTTPLNI